MAQTRLACSRCNGAFGVTLNDPGWDLCPSADRGEPCDPQPSPLPLDATESVRQDDPGLWAALSTDQRMALIGHRLDTEEGRRQAMEDAHNLFESARAATARAEALMQATIRATEREHRARMARWEG